MKNNLKTRLLALLLCLVMLFSVACTTQENPPSGEPNTPESGEPEQPEEDYPENGTKTILSETKNMYVSSDVVEELLVAYYEDCPEILLISADTAVEDFFAGFLGELVGAYEIDETETELKITRGNGAYCILNFVEDTIYFNNFDLFNAARSDTTADILGFPYVDEEGNSIYFQMTDSLNIAGLPIKIDLAARNIPLDIYEDQKYIPLQTFNDVFLAPQSWNVTYNSRDLFIFANGAVSPALEEQYYSVGAIERSEALAEYTANEFCLLLDLYYGLQDEHGVLVGFNTFLAHTGLWDDLTSTDANKSSLAIASLMFGFLADKHSSISKPSPYTGTPNVDKTSIIVDSSITHSVMFDRAITAARNELMPNGVPGYQEIGNTAYITFDSFTISDVRAEPYSEASWEPVDTLGLIIYAHQQITREDSIIENVVLDLSCNGGGAADAAIYVVAWMLGYCDLHMTNPITNSYSTASYVVDVNLDGEFNEKDSVADKNLYCIISPSSFSCGNLVPSLLKESGKVTLLGGTSGGGACAVLNASAADGTLFTISSPLHLCVVSNGSYYTVDRGVDPHYYFGKFESYFDRDALTDFINELK